MNRYCYALDLKNDPNLIEEYKNYHQAVWPEVLERIQGSGMANMEIYLVENRLFMIVESEVEVNSRNEPPHPKVAEWEALMWDYQQALPNTAPGEKWRKMDLVFQLNQP